MQIARAQQYSSSVWDSTGQITVNQKTILQNTPGNDWYYFIDSCIKTRGRGLCFARSLIRYIVKR